MSKILLDGEGVYRASILLRTINMNRKMKIVDYDSLLNIVNAIILWDDLYVFHERMSSYYIGGIDYFKQYSDNFHKIIAPLRLPKDLEKIEFECFSDFYESAGMNVDILKSNLEDIYIPGDVVNKLLGNEAQGYRAITYLLAANIHGMDYMPSIQRQVMLERYDYNSFFLRKDVIDKIDKELLHYYNRVNEHLPVKRIHYSFPVLLDYLLDKYSMDDIIKGAFELKHTKSLVDFRKEMDELDQAWENGNIKTVEKYFVEIEHIIDKLPNSTIFNKKFNVTISFPPALSFDMTIPHKRLVHSVFLKDLAFYGINHRKTK